MKNLIGKVGVFVENKKLFVVIISKMVMQKALTRPVRKGGSNE